MEDQDTQAGRRILFLTPQLPYPPEQGTALRNYNLVSRVARQHSVSLLSFVSSEASADLGPLADLCQEVIQVPAPTRSMRDRIRSLLFSPRPDMAERLASDRYASELLHLLRSQPFDCLQVEGIELAPYVPLVRRALGSEAPAIVFDDHNAEYLLQRRAFETDFSHPGRWLAAGYSFIQWQRLKRFEATVCRQADGVLAVSRADRAALRQIAPEQEALVIPNGVDTERYHPDLADSIPLKHPAITFTGKMDFRPNVDAVLWFYEKVWPQIKAEVVAAHFYVVGKAPHPRLTPLASDPQVTVTGYVPDILPYFGGSDIYVVPLRIGGGTRLKVLEALACGLPLVSTSLGAEGIDLVPGEHALLADSASQFAQAVIDILRDPDLARSLGRAGRRLASSQYEWDRIVPKLLSLYPTL